MILRTLGYIYRQQIPKRLISVWIASLRSGNYLGIAYGLEYSNNPRLNAWVWNGDQCYDPLLTPFYPFRVSFLRQPFLSCDLWAGVVSDSYEGLAELLEEAESRGMPAAS